MKIIRTLKDGKLEKINEQTDWKEYEEQLTKNLREQSVTTNKTTEFYDLLIQAMTSTAKETIGKITVNVNKKLNSRKNV